MKPNIYNFFKFLEEKENRPIPLKVKFLHAPEAITPEELDVKGNLDLRNTPITSLPEGLKVGRDLHLVNTLLAEKSDEDLHKMVEPNGYIKGKIYK